MNIFYHFHQAFVKILGELYPQIEDFTNVTCEIPREDGHGDISSNFALVLAKQIGDTPRNIALKLQPIISNMPEVVECTVAGPGFVNLKLSKEFWSQALGNIIGAGENYGKSNIGIGKKVNIEFVSANPTGPMHIGHARGAIVGDTLARLLEFVGFIVTKEYYVNDAGAQINKLAKSAYARYLQALGQQIELPTDGYPGEYLVATGEKLKEKYGNDLDGKEEDGWLDSVNIFAVSEMLDLIKKDLSDLGVKHDLFISERFDVVGKGKNDEAFSFLKDKDLIYKGVLEPPKGKVLEDWEPREQELFRSTAFGDDLDRPLRRSDGAYTYFAPDIAYHLDKIQRGYDELILLLGADHIGYVKRIAAAVKALSDNKVKIDVKITQLVNLLKNGEPFKMSKRAGNFVTVRDVLDEVGCDILRFVMLSRKSDTILDFDFDKVKEQSKENAVFYVQYAYTRACSVLRKAEHINSDGVNFELLTHTAEIELIKKMCLLPKILEGAVQTHEPHRLVFYMQELANCFHHLWSQGIEHEELRFIQEDKLQMTIARLGMLKAFKIVMKVGFNILGIKALESM